MHFGMLTLLTQPTEAQIKHQNREETSFTLNMAWLLVPLGFSHRTTLLFTCRKWSEKKYSVTCRSEENGEMGV